LRRFDTLPTFTATIGGELAGFLTLKQHYTHAAEIYVMGVEGLLGCRRGDMDQSGVLENWTLPRPIG
jgi:hypothetical protein